MGLKGKKANYEHIDANIIIRLIVRDDAKMVKKAEKLISKKDKVYILEDATIMEIVFILTGSLYNYTRKEAARSIKTVMEIENIYLNKGAIEDALDLYVGHPKLSFTDCYLASITTISGETPLWTFDHKLAMQCPVAREL